MSEAASAHTLTSQALDRLRGVLQTVIDEAEAQVTGLEHSLAFEGWMATTDAAELPREATRTAWLSESAFAATARIALGEVLGEDLALHHRPAFPHLYGSPLFRWFTPSPQLREQVAGAVAQMARSEPVELIGWLYQFTLDDESRRRFGQFYTPQTVVGAMLDGVGFSGDGALQRRVLDPACGAGAYLIEATRRIQRAAAESGVDAADRCRRVEWALHGLDRSPLGVLLTEAAIALLLAPDMIEAGRGLILDPLRLYVTDTLRSTSMIGETHPADAEAVKHRRGRWEGGFDLVIGNPPYGKLARADLSEEQIVNFHSILYGQPNLYAMFLKVGIDLLAEGGHLSFIMPRSWVSGLHFGALRRYVSSRVDVRSIDTFSARSGLFEGVLQEVMIFHAAQGRQGSHVTLREWAGPPVKDPVHETKAQAASVLLDGGFGGLWMTDANPVSHRAAHAMASRGTPLAELGWRVSTGTVVWNRMRKEISDEMSGTAPLIWGNGVQHMRFAGAGNREGRHTRLRLTGKTASILVTGDALLVRRMTSKEDPRRVLACRLPAGLRDAADGWFAENHVNVLRREDDSPVPSDALLGLLSSRLVDYVLRSLNGTTQISAHDLKTLPVPIGSDAGLIEQIALETAAIQAGGRDEERLNRLVYRLYGISASDQAAIDRYYADRRTSAAARRRTVSS